MAHEREPSVKRVVTLRMFVNLTRHGANYRQFVSDRRKLRKHTANFESALPVFFKFEWRCHHVAIAIELSPLNLHRHRFSMQFAQLRLRVKRIDLGHSARHVA